VGILEQRGSAIAAGEWQCVHIPQGRVFGASYRTFMSMVHAESCIPYDPKTEYPIYCLPAPEGDGVRFVFSPPAAQRFNKLIKFWGGIPFQAAEHLKLVQRVL